VTDSSDPILSGELVITHRLVDASNATLFGEIEGYGAVIYKPIAGERPLWDFPNGTLADREVAAYKLSEFLRFEVVPRTVLRDGPFGPGMVQRWIDVDQSRDLIEFGQGGDVQLRNLALFDALINNTDRKFGHLLLDIHGKLFGCDHGVTFHEENKLRTVLWQFAGEDLQEAEKERLLLLTENQRAVSAMLQPHLTGVEIAALFARNADLLAAGTFPFPSTEWPAVPWPPV
jgi:hypothetical protein